MHASQPVDRATDRSSAGVEAMGVDSCRLRVPLAHELLQPFRRRNHPPVNESRRHARCGHSKPLRRCAASDQAPECYARGLGLPCSSENAARELTLDPCGARSDSLPSAILWVNVSVGLLATDIAAFHGEWVRAQQADVLGLVDPHTVWSFSRQEQADQDLVGKPGSRVGLARSVDVWERLVEPDGA